MYNSPSPSQRYQDRQAEDIEGQNDEALGALSQKVRLLKNITINIGNEVRDSTKMLNGMVSHHLSLLSYDYGLKLISA